MVGVVAGGDGAGEDAAEGEEEVELLVADLEEVLGVELDGGVAGEVEDPFDEAAVLAEDLEGEAAAGEVVEDAGVVAGDVHAAAEAGEVDVNGRFLGVAAQDDGVGLHVVLEVLALELREARLHVAAGAGGSHGGVGKRGRESERNEEMEFWNWKWNCERLGLGFGKCW